MPYVEYLYGTRIVPLYEHPLVTYMYPETSMEEKHFDFMKTGPPDYTLRFVHDLANRLRLALTALVLPVDSFSKAPSTTPAILTQ